MKNISKQKKVLQKDLLQHFSTLLNHNTLVETDQFQLNELMLTIFLGKMFSPENYLFMSDDSSKDGDITATHTKKLLQWLCKSTKINTTGIAIWEDTDGFVEQCGCATALFYCAFQIFNDQEINAPG